MVGFSRKMSYRFSLQSVSPTWYFQTNDECGMTGGKKDTTKYLDTMFKNVVIAPAEVKTDGMGYFDAQEDVKTPGEADRRHREVSSRVSIHWKRPPAGRPQ